MPRLRIEDKHTYNTTPQRTLEFSISSTATGGMNFVTNPVINEFKYPISGVEENERVGRKIQTTSLMSEGYIYLDTQLGYSEFGNFSLRVPFYQAFYGNQEVVGGNQQLGINETLPGYVGRKAVASGLANDSDTYTLNPLQETFDMTIRHFVVEFDDPTFVNMNTAAQQAYIRNWYNYLVIQIAENEVSSNSMQVKRESTPYTGTFKILYDKTHHLTRTNPQLHYTYTIPYKRHLNFEAFGSDVPTNKTVVEVFIPATNYKLDFGNLAFGNYLYDFAVANLSAEAQQIVMINEGFINSTLKLKYIDV